MMKKKILFFGIGKNEMSGGQTMIFNILNKIDKEKFEVELLLQTPCPLSKMAEDIGINVHFIELPRMYNFFKGKIVNNLFNAIILFLFSFKISFFTKKQNYDVVWCENITALLSSIMIRAHKKKIIYNMWSMVNSKYTVKLICSLSDHIIVEGNFQKKIFNDFNPPSITVIYTQIAEDVFQDKLNRTHSDRIIGFIGGGRYSKGFDRLVNVAYKLSESDKCKDIYFYVAGVSSEDDLIQNEEMKEKLNVIGNNIVLDSWISEKSHFYNNIDLFLSLSRSEGLPGAVREAMGFGLPIIATDVGGTREALGDTGILITETSEEKVVNRVSREIKSILSDASRKKRYEERALKRAQDLFIGDSWIKKLEETIHLTLNQRKN